jgi:hypothetical protein
MIHANGFQQALQALNVPTPVLKSYYHNIIDRQFWLKKYRRRLQRLSPKAIPHIKYGVFSFRHHGRIISH